ncbi:MAG: hypothetical protein HFE59_11245 [Clostridiales bacterium]|nr:hypothetical protein [Clostridiales bacterium]
MKKFIALSLIAFVFVGGGNNLVGAKDKEIENLKKEIEELKQEKAKNENLGITEIMSENVAETTTEAPKQDIQSKVSVMVTDKISKPMDFNVGRIEDFVEFKIDVTNNTNCAIKGIQGTLYVDDLFGENIMPISWDFTGGMIYSGKTINYSGKGISINPYIHEESKIYNTDYKDLKFRYKVKQIVYSDETVEKAD